MKRSLLALLLLCTGCSTLVNGPTQKVCITTKPSGARVSVDNCFVGTTPIRVDMRRSSRHVVTLDLSGYETMDIHFDKHVSGWVFGNIVFGGLIGLAIDAVSGSMFRLTPEQLHTELSAGNVTISKKSKYSHIIVVMEPKSDWEKVGALVRK